MKALVISKPRYATAMGITLGLLLLSPANDANAAPVKFVPEAACTTIATNTPLPTYVCCKQYDQANQEYAFRNMWVSGSCQNVAANATYDTGCKPSSLVYGTNKPIPPMAGFCQYSYSAIKNGSEYLF